MGTRKSLLSGIAYIASYVPKSPKPVPKLLEDEKSWKKLIQGAADYIDACKQKKNGKGVVKPFSIRIFDTSGEDPGKATAGAVKKVGGQNILLHPSNLFSGQEGQGRSGGPPCTVKRGRVLPSARTEPSLCRA
jgi:hypothetical protein